MTDKANEISSCLQYLEKYVEDEDNVEIIFYQDEEDEDDEEGASGCLYDINKLEAVKAITFKAKYEAKGSDTGSEYDSSAVPGPSTKNKLSTEIVHKKCVTTYSRKDFKPSETQSTNNESRSVIGDIVIEYDNNQMEFDDENVQKPRRIIGIRLNHRKAQKTSEERFREFRARKALLKQQARKQQEEPDAIVEITTEDIRSTKQKLQAQRMREYRKRKKLAKKLLLKKQSDQDLDAIASSSSSQVNQRSGPSTINTINSISAELQSQQLIETSERENDNTHIESNNPWGNNADQSDLRDSTLNLLKYDDITKHEKAHENFDRQFRKIPFGYSCTVKDSTISTSPVRFRADSENPNTTATQKVTNDGLIAEDVDEIPNFTGNSKNDDVEDDAQTILPKFQCFVCSFNCTRKSDLTKHLEKHFNPRHCFPCTVCKKQFPTKRRLNIHINSIADIRSYQCEKCNKTFSAKFLLGRHLKETHSGIKPYKCTKCDYATFYRCRLKYHMVVHRSDRPFKCLRCPYASKCKKYLTLHLKIHTDDKPYKCDKCKFRFVRADYLRKHIKSHFMKHDKTHH